MKSISKTLNNKKHPVPESRTSKTAIDRLMVRLQAKKELVPGRDHEYWHECAEYLVEMAAYVRSHMAPASRIVPPESTFNFYKPVKSGE